MRTEVYDVNQNGIVDNAEKVNNHTVNSDVPADAVFTDTTYTAGTGIDITNGVITNTQTSAEWGNITGTLSDQTDLKNALDLKSDLSYVNGKIGDLSNLTTTAKNNVVSAINEVDSHADTNATNIGDLTTLTTTTKSSLVGAVNELDSDKLDATATAVNSTKWDNKEQDWATENNTDTWIPVLKDTKMQHTTISSLVKRGIQSKSVSGTPDSNGFLPLGLGLSNVIVGYSGVSSSYFVSTFYETNANRLTAKVETWNRSAVTTSVSLTVYYIEL